MKNLGKSPFPSSANNFNISPENFKEFENKYANYSTYIDYYKRLRLLALSMFEWINLPQGMNALFLERTLYENGIACFVNDSEKGYMNLRCTPSDKLNVYEEAQKYTAYSIEYNKVYDKDDIIIVYNNIEALPTDTTIRLFAWRLCQCERTMDININAQKTPYIIKATDSTKLTFKNLFEQISDNAYFLFVNPKLEEFGDIEVLETHAPFVADKLSAYKKNLWAEALSFLGINNVDTEKKSHLITAEVNSNNQLVSLSSEVMLMTRKRACEQFNVKFGMNIDVKLRTYIDGEVVQDQGEYSDE